jgi:hypothetical protein
MDWLQFTAAMFGHLVWPIVVLIIVFAVRKYLLSHALGDHLRYLRHEGPSQSSSVW